MPESFYNIGYFNAASLDIYNRFGDSIGGGDPAGFGESVGRSIPSHAEAARFTFFTDPNRRLWKFVDDAVFPIGAGFEDSIKNHVLAAHLCLEYPRVGRTTFDLWAEAGGLPKLTINVPVAFYDDSLKGTGTTEVVGLTAWVCGYPFQVTEETAIGGDPDHYYIALAPFAETYFDAPYANGYKGWDTDLLHVVHDTDEIIFSPAHAGLEDFLYDYRETDETAKTYPEQEGPLTGEYEYVMTAVTKYGYETNPCAAINIKADKQIIKLVMEDFNLDRYLEYDFDYIRSFKIYRSYSDSPGHFYLLDYIPHGTTEYNWKSKCLYIDAKPDYELGASIHKTWVFPQYADSLAASKNTLCIADGPGVYISEVGDPESVSRYQAFESTVIGVAAIPYFDYFLVFLRNAIYSMDIYNAQIQLISSKVGLIGKGAMTVLDDRVVFMAPGGNIYQFSGGRPVPLAGFDKVKDILNGNSTKRKLNRIAFPESFMFSVPKYRQVWCVFGEGNMLGNFVLVHELDKPVYLVFKFPFNLTCAVSFENAGEQCVMLCTENGDTYIYTPIVTADDGTPIQFYIESHEIGVPNRQIRIRRFYSEVISESEIDLTLEGNYDREGYVPEGVLSHLASDRGDERHKNMYPWVVPTYQFTLKEESLNTFKLKQMALLLQPKSERIRNAR